MTQSILNNVFFKGSNTSNNGKQHTLSTEEKLIHFCESGLYPNLGRWGHQKLVQKKISVFLLLLSLSQIIDSPPFPYHKHHQF